MAQAIAFYTLSTLILGFAVAVISARSTVHSVLFLVIDFLLVAALYVALGAEFLAVIQVLVYAGGIVVLYLFVVMLVNLKRPAETYSDPRRRGRVGLVLSGVVLGELVAIVFYSVSHRIPAVGVATAVAGNTEKVGWMLYMDYLIPFEVASILLLVAMIGAIILSKRQV